nr:immunoglobulin heavy chain junction region [Mus musculus]
SITVQDRPILTTSL